MGFTPSVASRRSVAARNRLVEENQHLIRPIAAALSRRLPPCFPIEDLEQWGACGLLDAAERFQEGREATWAAYARVRIKGAILDAIAGRSWKDSTAAPLDDAAIRTVADSSAVPIDQELERRERIQILRQAIAGLPERQRTVIELRYGRDTEITQESAGASMGVTQQRVNELEREALARLRRRLLPRTA
jgi:RNA polymerase sigma factor for flagellar operon FliA